MSPMIIAKGPIGAILWQQHETSTSDVEPLPELILQPPQPDRRVEAPGSEIVRVDHDLEHDAHRETVGRLSRHTGHGHKSRR
jgi:hypothetical protein